MFMQIGIFRWKADLEFYKQQIVEMIPEIIKKFESET